MFQEDEILQAKLAKEEAEERQKIDEQEKKDREQRKKEAKEKEAQNPEAAADPMHQFEKAKADLIEDLKKKALAK